MENRRKKFPLIMGLLCALNEVWLGFFLYFMINDSLIIHYEVNPSVVVVAIIFLANLFVIFSNIKLFFKSNTMDPKKYNNSLINLSVSGFIFILTGLYIFWIMMAWGDR